MTDPNALAMVRLLLMGRAVDMEVEAWQVVELAQPWTYDDTTWTGALIHSDHNEFVWCEECLACTYLNQLAAGNGPPLVVPPPPGRHRPVFSERGRHKASIRDSATVNPSRPLGGRHRLNV